jgi:Flp pilus assembly protein TadG
MSVPRLRAQGLAELAMVLPGLLLLLLITVGLGVVMRADGGVAAVSIEAARASALASDATSAVEAAQARAHTVADGYGLISQNLRLTVETSDFRRGGTVRVVVNYTLPLRTLPLVGWVEVPLRHESAERIAPNRSFR